MAQLEHVLQLVAPSKVEISQVHDTLQVTDFIFYLLPDLISQNLFSVANNKRALMYKALQITKGKKDFRKVRVFCYKCTSYIGRSSGYR